MDRILAEAKPMCDTMLKEVNVRFVWSNDQTDTVPVHLLANLVTNSFIEDEIATSQNFQDLPAELAFLEVRGLTMGQSGAPPSKERFDEIIGVFPGAFTNLQVVDLD